MRRCRLGAAEGAPFACPDNCLFFEERALSTAGWATESGQPMANTSLGLAALPPAGGRRGPARPAKGKKKGKKGR